MLTLRDSVNASSRRGNVRLHYKRQCHGKTKEAIHASTRKRSAMLAPEKVIF